MERNLDDRAYALAVYMLEHNATVRAAAARFGVSKSTVHRMNRIYKILCISKKIRSRGS